jgi:glutamate/tyrosine decarboxylase-like PLP-dependent enzyme
MTSIAIKLTTSHNRTDRYTLAAHGSRAITEAVEATLALTRVAADLVRSRDFLELIMEPELSVVLFRRKGWGPEEYHTWSDRELEKGRHMQGGVWHHSP